MKSKIALVISAVTGALGFYSCSDPYNESIELKQFMYLSLTGATDGVVAMDVEIDRDTTCTVSVFYGGTTNYEQGEMSAEVAVNNSLVETYNKEKGTTYLPLSASYYVLNKTSVIIPNGSRVSDPVLVTIKSRQIDFSGKKEYLLPVTISSASGGNLQLNEELKTVYYTIKPAVYNWQKETWEVIALKSEWNSGTACSKVIDGNKSTYWHSEPFDGTKNGFPQWFVIDMKKQRPIINGIKIWNRPDDHGMEPKNIVFSVSDDNVNWTTILNIEAMSQEYQTELNYAATNPKGGRYLKVEVVSAWSTNPWTALAEITPYQ